MPIQWVHAHTQKNTAAVYIKTNRLLNKNQFVIDNFIREPIPFDHCDYNAYKLCVHSRTSSSIHCRAWSIFFSPSFFPFLNAFVCQNDLKLVSQKCQESFEFGVCIIHFETQTRTEISIAIVIILDVCSIPAFRLSGLAFDCCWHCERVM